MVEGGDSAGMLARMTGRELRARVLVSLGLVGACQSKASPPPEAPMAANTPDAGATGANAPTDARPSVRTCGVDEVLEREEVALVGIDRLFIEHRDQRREGVGRDQRVPDQMRKRLRRSPGNRKIFGGCLAEKIRRPGR